MTDLLINNPSYDADQIKVWADMGVHTEDDLERLELSSAISDCYRDAYGIRPRHYDYDAMTVAEMREVLDGLSVAVEDAIEREREMDAKAVVDFEKEIQIFIDNGAGDRANALRWMVQGETFQHAQDVEHWVWNRGILFTDAGREVVKEIEAIILH